MKVPVNEDYLFDVDIEHRELAPTYWLGPIYDVRRGSWFHQEGSTLRPCDENLASQLEEGFLKVKPWRTLSADVRGATSEPSPETPVVDTHEMTTEQKAATGVARGSGISQNDPAITDKFQLQTQRLFGTYMSSVVTYQDARTAWILTDDFLSRMSSTVYQRFAGGGHLGGTKVVRGFTEEVKVPDPKKDVRPAAKLDAAKDAVNDPNAKHDGAESENPMRDEAEEPEPSLRKLERQMSNFVSSPNEDPMAQEAKKRQRDEDEIKGDYVDADGQDQGREIEHLILVVSALQNSLNANRC